MTTEINVYIKPNAADGGRRGLSSQGCKFKALSSCCWDPDKKTFVLLPLKK